MAGELNAVEEAIAAIAAGALVIVVDDADRQNEGDLIMAAANALPEQVAFMIRHTSGILCAPLPPEDARRLRRDPIVAHDDAPLGTAFTVSVAYRIGRSRPGRDRRAGARPGSGTMSGSERRSGAISGSPDHAAGDRPSPLCRSVGLRHRDRPDRAARRLTTGQRRFVAHANYWACNLTLG